VPLTQDQLAQPFSAYVAMGARFPDGPNDEYEQLCLSFLPDRRTEAENLLTDVGAKALAWLESSNDEREFIKERSLSHRMGLGGRLTDLEDYLEEIGRKTGTNFAAYLRVLVEEINEKTPWRLGGQPWKHTGHWHSRLRIRKEEPSESALVRQVQLHALQHGKALEAEVVKAKLDELLGDKD